MPLDPRDGPVCPRPEENSGQTLDVSTCLSQEVERIQKDLDRLKLQPQEEKPVNYSLPSEFRLTPSQEIKLGPHDPFAIRTDKPLTDKDIDRLIKENRMPLGGALPLESFKLDPDYDKSGRLNLNMPKDYYGRPTSRYGPMQDMPMLPPNEDIRRWLDRKVTTDFQMGNNTVTFSLNGRRCGLRSRPALCFSTPIK